MSCSINLRYNNWPKKSTLFSILVFFVIWTERENTWQQNVKMAKKMELSYSAVVLLLKSVVICKMCFCCCYFFFNRLGHFWWWWWWWCSSSSSCCSLQVQSNNFTNWFNWILYCDWRRDYSFFSFFFSSSIMWNKYGLGNE